MPKAPTPLTVKEINGITAAGRHRVSEGLYLRVTGTGKRHWDVRITANGKRTWKTVGDASAVSAQVARRLALTVEPPESTNKVRRFGTVWDEYIERHSDSWKSHIHLRQWEQTGRDYVIPALGQRPIDEIRPEHVAAMLAPLWQTKHETARRIRGRVSLVIDFELARLGLLHVNPAEMKFISKLLPRHKQTEKHHAAPSLDELRALL
jgi:hypothetical protein